MRYKKPIFWTCVVGILLLWGGYTLNILPTPVSHWIAQVSAIAAGNKKNQAIVLASDFTKLVERYSPAVVNIQTYHDESNALQKMLPPATEHDPLWDFFHHFTPPDSNARHALISGGSGFIISADGYLLTSAHLVQHAGYITVTCMDKREFQATVVGFDQRTDIALLKIKAHDLPVVQIGHPATLQVGEWVVAIGSPFQLDHTVTAGIISATRRNLPDGSYIPFIQTDVAINVGSSGGPLFNLNGEVIGINTKIYSKSGEFSGIAFAVPIDIAMHAANQIKKIGQAQHSKLGVYIQPVTQGIAQAFTLDRPRGILIAGLEEQGPAHQAGLKTGDILLSIDQQAIESYSDLSVVLSKTTPSQVIMVTIWRHGTQKTLRIKLGQLPADRVIKHHVADQRPYVASPNKRLEAMGATLSPLTLWQKKQLRLPQGGLIVQQVEDRAARAGLMRGDVIIGVNHRQPINTLSQLRIVLAQSNGYVALLVQRAEERLFIPLSFN